MTKVYCYSRCTSGIIILAFSLLFLSACTEAENHPNGQNTQTSVNNQSNAETVAQEPSAPEGATERSASTLAVPETIVDGVILPEYYEFEYPEEFRSFMDSCIDYSQHEDIDALSELCGFGGTNQDAVQKIEQYCLDGIGMYQFRKHRNWTWGSDRGRDSWHYSFWYEGYRCNLCFLEESRTHYEWTEFWLIPDDGKGYAAFFYPGSQYSGDDLEFLVINCKNGLFDGSFYGTGRYTDTDGNIEITAMSGNLTRGVLDGECIRGAETIRYENGRLMEYWKTEDPSTVIDADGYNLNLSDYYFTAGNRRCIYEETDRGIVWDPF